MRPGSALGLFVALASLQGSPVSSQSVKRFEGQVRYRIERNGRPLESVYMAKGSRTRSELQMGPNLVVMLQDAATGETTMIDPTNRVYRVMTLPAVEGMPTMRLTRLGTRDRVAGYDCENFRIVTEGVGATEVCAARGQGQFDAGVNLPNTLRTMAARNPEFARTLREGFLPLRITTTRSGGAPVVMEATSVEKKSLAASLFEVPAGYRKVEMPGMPRRP